MSLFREPTLHFLVLGGLLFVLHARLAEPEGPGAEEIVITGDTLDELAAGFRLEFGREPEASEIEGLIAQYGTDEALYREAVALGLDRGDPIVRRRLIQSMRFLTEDLARPAEVTDDDIDAWIATNTDELRAPLRLAFEHVYVSRDRYGAGVEAEARTILASIRAGEDPESLGNPFLRGRRFGLRTETDYAGVFGPTFAGALAGLPVGQWSEPVASSYGVHLVRIDRREEPRVPERDEVADYVRGRIGATRAAEANDAAIQAIRDRYVIVREE